MKMYGQVIFMEYNEKTNEFDEIGKTSVIEHHVALNIYAETPNPPSQILKGATKEEIKKQYTQLMKDRKNPDWVKMLLESI